MAVYGVGVGGGSLVYGLSGSAWQTTRRFAVLRAIQRMRWLFDDLIAEAVADHDDARGVSLWQRGHAGVRG